MLFLRGALLGALVCCVVAKSAPLTLLISFDGFRWNYIGERTNTPNFDRLINTGVKAKWIRDVFVSKTFPNHYTLATGLYEESHGIVGNEFYDPRMNKTFSLANANSWNDTAFWGGEPIWITAEKQGIKTGTYFWVGSETVIDGMLPSAYRRYATANHTYPGLQHRVDTVVNWLANKPTDQEKAMGIRLALLYFYQPDHDGHTFGPESDEVTKRIEQCDKIIGYLIQKLIENNLYDKVNIIITSDHGMAELNQTETIPLFSYVNDTMADHIINYGTGAAIWPKPGYLDTVYKSLMKMDPEQVFVWKKSEIPDNYHYKHNIRIPPILINVKDGWFLVDYPNDPLPMRGTHGYNNSLQDMHPFFIAHGPAFRQNYVSEPFDSVDVYGLICHILGITPALNNGSFTEVEHLLRVESKDVIDPVLMGVIVGIVLVLGLFVYTVQSLQPHCCRREKQNHRAENGEAAQALL
ncbi:ectonucleotide pyrophosphatase/phosphodiesterase family member 5-like [Ciona intestinalis]